MSDTFRTVIWNNLPAPMNSLIGRGSEMSLLTELLGEARNRLVTLTGPGGVGKTRLALELGGKLNSEFKDGVFVVTLSGLYETPEIVSAIGQALRLKETVGQTPFESLKSYLNNRSLLLILDNLEQSRQVTALVAELLESAKELKVLGTGRTGLNAPGEKVFQVLPLSTPDQGQFTTLRDLENSASVVLFSERARLVRPDFTVSIKNGAHIAKICWRLSGLPLALELAAARIKTLSPQALLSRLDRGLEILSGGPVDRPVQQQTLEATIEWSYNLLSQPEQEFFTKLAVFGGSWSLEAAQAVFREEVEGTNTRTGVIRPAWTSETEAKQPAPDTVPQTVENLLSSLVSQSLLYLIANPHGGNRYEMLEIIHEYAWKRLALTGREEVIFERHAAYYLELAEQIASHLTGPEQGYWYRQLDLDYVNLRAALNFLIGRANPARTASSTISGLRLALALWRFWHFRGLLKDGLDWIKVALNFSRKNLAEGDFSESDTETITGLQYRLLAAQAVLALDMGQYDYARRLLEESLAWHREKANQLEIAAILNKLGGIAANQGNYSQAAVWYQESLQLQQQLGDRRGLAIAFCSLAAARQASGDYDEAKGLYQQAMPLIQEVGDRQVLAQLLNNYGEIMRTTGEYAEARSYFVRSLSINEEINDIHGISRSYISLGELLLSQGAYGQASDLLGQALLKLNRIGDKRYIAVCLEAYAIAATRTNNDRMAARLLGAAAALRVEIGAPLEPGERPRLEELAGENEQKLGKDEFAAYHNEGYDLPLEETLNLILNSEVTVN